MIIHVTKPGSPCALCYLAARERNDYQPDRIGFFLAGLAYGLQNRDLSICTVHLPQFRKSAEEAGDFWDDAETNEALN